LHTQTTIAPPTNFLQALFFVIRTYSLQDLEARTSGPEPAIRATAADTEDAVRDMEEDEAKTRQALDLFNSGRDDA
jgi:hypothetical protein